MYCLDLFGIFHPEGFFGVEMRLNFTEDLLSNWVAPAASFSPCQFRVFRFCFLNDSLSWESKVPPPKATALNK